MHYNSYRKIFALAASITMCSFASAYDYWFPAGEFDLEAHYEDGSLGMGVHNHTGDQELEADQVLFYAGQNSRTARPASSAYDFIGVGAAETYWLLPDTQIPDRIYLGFGLEEMDPDDPLFAPYAISDPRIAGTARWMTISLTGVSGPGDFSVWQETDDGPLVWMSSADGIGASDKFLSPFGGHSHMNFAFTATGVYGIDLQASTWLDTNSNGGLDAGDTQIFSEATTYNFSVEAVPEPTTMVAIGAGLLMLKRRKDSKLS